MQRPRLPAYGASTPRNSASAGVDIAPSRLTVWPVFALRATMKGTASAPKLLSNYVLLLMA